MSQSGYSDKTFTDYRLWYTSINVFEHKNTMKSRTAFLASVVLVGIGIIGMQVYTQWPQKTVGPEITPTQPISYKQNMGGVTSAPAESKDKQQAESSATTDVAKPEQAALVQKAIDVAPRQAEITRGITTEYPYQALRSSNDPIQQPAWVNAAIKQNTAWDTATGNGVVVAVIDTGYGLAHDDLASQWHQNVNETGTTSVGEDCWTGTPASKTTNNCDDDDNGYVDDWRGWDFVGVNNSPQAGQSNPTGSGVAHGTQVAGLVGTAGNNGVGTATVAWNNKIMPLQALDDNGSGYTSSVVAAVYYAADNGASVINLSLGGAVNDTALATAIRYAYDRNIVVVAAAGNCGTGAEQGCDPAKPGAMGYPALNPYVIAVGATTSTNARASFSSYGPGLDAVAPGSGTLVSPMWTAGNPTSAYASSLYGTSFASPIVASYVGLLKSIRPSTSVNDMTALVNATTFRPASMGSEYYTNGFGHGIVDTAKGLQVATNLNQTVVVPELFQTGNNISEHMYSASSAMSSGCAGTVGSYCTIWANNANGYDRFLPYTLTNGSGAAGWSWQGSWLGEGNWDLRARSGAQQSTTPYGLANK